MSDDEKRDEAIAFGPCCSGDEPVTPETSRALGRIEARLRELDAEERACAAAAASTGIYVGDETAPFRVMTLASEVREAMAADAERAALSLLALKHASERTKAEVGRFLAACLRAAGDRFDR